MLASDLPSSGVTVLSGTSAAALVAAADHRTPSDPILILPGLSTPLPSAPRAVIDDVLDRLLTVALALYPAWRPDTGNDAASSPALDTLAAHARTAQRPDSSAAFTGLPAADRREALERALTRSYRVHGLALAIEVDEPPVPHLADALCTAAQWLARGTSAVWLIGPGTRSLDRFPRITPGEVGTGPERATTAGPVFPPLPGHPHPSEPAQADLEGALSGCRWAAGRIWNRSVDLGPDRPPVRVDLLFGGARLVVQVDGAGHLEPARYEDDRRRDADLMLAGFRVLRLTDTRIFTDLPEALAIIRTLVEAGDPAGEGGAW
ncbi:hypothetical protein GCM10027289_11560 [Tsukamurella serpentis]